MLFDHQTSMVIGRQSAGTLDAMDDGSGIVATGYPPDTSWARDLRTSMERGDIDRMRSVLALEDDIAWVPSEAAPDGGYVLRTVLRARVSELSVVAIPAYPQTVALARASVTGELRRRVWAALPSELREGKVLSADNLAALIQIHDLTETVLNGADPKWATDGQVAGEASNEAEPGVGAGGDRSAHQQDTGEAGGSPVLPSGAGPARASDLVAVPGVGFMTVKGAGQNG